MQAHSITKPAAGGKPWSSGLCDCCTDIPVCLWVSFCYPCAVGQLIHDVYAGLPTVTPSEIPFTLLLGNSEAFTGKCIRYSLLFACLSPPHPGLVAVRVYLSSYLRTDMRETYQLEATTPCCECCANSCCRTCTAAIIGFERRCVAGACDGCRPSLHITRNGRVHFTEPTDCHDYCTHVWCGPCALCQEIRCSRFRNEIFVDVFAAPSLHLVDFADYLLFFGLAER